MNAVVASLIIVIVALLAWVAYLKHKSAVAIGMVILVGILLGNAPGVPGDLSQTICDWMFIDVPDWLKTTLAS